MAIKYYPAPDVKKIAEDIVYSMGWDHISLLNVGFVRSRGSSSRRTIARCHAMGKAMQIGMGRTTGFYLVEVISEKYDHLPPGEQTKVIIHELMHIPKSFGGGFIHHDKVHDESVGDVYEKYISLKNRMDEQRWF